MQKWNRLPAWTRIGYIAGLLIGALLAAAGWAPRALAQGKPGPAEPAPTAAGYTATPLPGLPDNRVWTITFAEDSADPNSAWVGTYSGGLSIYDGDNWRTYSEEDGLADNDVHAIYFAFDGPALIGTARGLSEYDPIYYSTAWRTVTREDGLASNGIEDIAIGRGRIWVTHLAEGVSQFDGMKWTRYTTDDGLADNWVHAVTRDVDGRMWFATNAGVSRFDNEVWTTYTTADGLVDNTVFAAASAPDGHLWFGTSAGLSEFDGEQWKTHLPGQPIAEIAISPAGVVWAVGGDTVNRYNGGRWQSVLPAYFQGQDLRAVAINPLGEVWVGSFGAGIIILTPTTACDAPIVATKATIWAGIPTGIASLHGDNRQLALKHVLYGADVRAILIDSQGRKWFMANSGALVNDGANWTSHFPSPQGPSSNDVYQVAVDPQGRTWFAYGDRGLGVSVKEGDTWRQYTSAEGLGSERIYSMAFGAQGEVWLGSEQGVIQQNRSHWTNLAARPGAPDGKIETLAVSPTGELWAGFTGGVARYDGKRWTTFGPEEGLEVGAVRTIAFDDAGAVWLGAAPAPQYAANGGLFVYDGGDWTAFDMNRTPTVYTGPAAQPLGDWISGLAFDRDGNLWAGALAHPLAKPGFVHGGVSVYHGAAPGGVLGDVGWTVYAPGNGLPSEYVTALAVDASGVVWAGTQAGLSRFDGAGWTTYTAADGLPTDQITALAADPSGGVWIAIAGSGASFFDGETWEHVSTTGLADRAVRALAEDAAGNIWFATAGGVSRFDGEGWRAYTVLDGLASSDSSAVTVDGSGAVWVGGAANPATGAVLSRFDGVEWRTYTLGDGARYTRVDALAVDDEGRAWAVAHYPNQFSSASALFVFDGAGWRQQAAGPGPLGDDQVYALAIDRAGAVWLGTDGSYGSAPLLVWDGAAWSSYPEIAAGAVLAIALEGPGCGWLGTDIGLARLDMEPGEVEVTYHPLLRDMPVQAVALEPPVDRLPSP